MSDIDARLWRRLDRAVLVLAVGVALLLVGLGPEPDRVDSVYGLIIVALAVLPALVTVLRLPARARSALRHLPRHRPLLTTTAVLAASAAVLIASWSTVNALFPGTYSPLALALLAALAAGVTAVIGRLSRRVRAGVGKVAGARRARGTTPAGPETPKSGLRRDER